MNEQSILERLSFHNPWWITGSVPKSLVPKFQRNIVQNLLSYLKSNRAILLKGPRRVGKTTVFYQLIDILLKDKIKPKNICYISFDDPLLKVPLEEILKSYQQYRGQKLTTGNVYIFLDEAQFLKDWEFTVKLYLDRKYPVKFFVSGSSISLLTQKTESLSGRIIEEISFPFSFREYLSFFVKDLDIAGHFKQKNLFPEHFPRSLVPFIADIEIQFANFLYRGGFPQVYSESEDEISGKFIKDDIIDKVVFRDLVELYKIREPSYLEKLFYFLGQNTSGIINITTLSQSLGISRVIVERYISYLERALIYFRLPKFSKSLKETLRSNPKGHLIDPSLGRFFGAKNSEILKSVVASFLFQKFSKKVYFWRDQFHEVDVIINDKEIIPVEIKDSYQKEVPNGLLYVVEKQKLSRGFVVHQGEFKKVKVGKKSFFFYPVWYFLLGDI